MNEKLIPLIKGQKARYVFDDPDFGAGKWYLGDGAIIEFVGYDDHQNKYPYRFKAIVEKYGYDEETETEFKTGVKFEKVLELSENEFAKLPKQLDINFDD